MEHEIEGHAVKAYKVWNKQLHSTNKTMKLKLIIIFLSVFLIKNVTAQNIYKGLPLVKANANKADLKINNDFFKGVWTINPIKNDTASLRTFDEKEKMNVSFFTDIDSIEFSIKGGKSKSFYVFLNQTSYILVTIRVKVYYLDKLQYTNKASNPFYTITYDNTINNSYLDSLKTKYPITITNSNKEVDKVLEIMNWTHHQWKHNGNQSPKKSDAISILNEVKEGGRFPCFAYATVLAAQLKVAGFTARVLYLKTKDIETSINAGGHVVTEVYLNSLKKWVYVDAQFNAMPSLKGIPLNAVEFQNAIKYNYSKLEFKSLDMVNKKDYCGFVYSYLYFFNTEFDQREGAITNRKKVDGKSDLMLVPIGAKNPSVMLSYGSSKIDYCIYTNTIKDFYAEPLSY